MAQRRVFASKEEFDAFTRELYEQYTYTFGDWQFNWATREVTDDGKTIRLTERMADVLKALLDHGLTNYIYSADLAQHLNKDHGVHMGSDSLKTYIYRLRDRIGQGRIDSQQAGYKFIPFPEEE